MDGEDDRLSWRGPFDFLNSSSERTLMRLLIFSEKMRSRPAACRASSWIWRSCWAVEQRA
jgi:hypothetical protein